MKKKLKIPAWASFGNQKRILKEGFKSHKYYEKLWKNEIQRYVDGTTDNDFKKIGWEQWGKAFGKALLLILIYIAIVVVLILILKQPFLFLLKQVKKVAPHISAFLKKVTPDSWIGFIGSIIGSIVTMIGLIITIKFERHKDEEERKRQAQPIIILPSPKLLCNTDDARIYSMQFCTSIGEKKGYNRITIKTPNIFIKNIGFNVALNSELMFIFDGCISMSLLSYEYIANNEYVHFNIKMEMHEQEIKKHFGEIIYRIKDGEKNFHGYLLTAYSNLDKELHEKIKYVTRKSGTLFIKYQDIYGNEYEQKYKVTLWLVKLLDGTYTLFLTHPTSAHEIVQMKRKNNKKLGRW